ncbi:MAG: hypothetical protein DGJ47_000551 [Rickettsiaceae bacterium]
MQTYSGEVIAKLLNLSVRRVQQLAKDDIIPKSDKGKYDLVASVRGYIKYLYERAYGQNKETIDSHAEKARLLKAQAEKAELELKIMQDKYMALAEIEFLWSGMLLSFRGKILSLPTKIVHKIAGAGGDLAKIERMLTDELHDVLMELSNTQYGQHGQKVAGFSAKDSSENCSTAKVKSQSVG